MITLATDIVVPEKLDTLHGIFDPLIPRMATVFAYQL
jgi:hypothetical protein